MVPMIPMPCSCRPASRSLHPIFQLPLAIGAGAREAEWGTVLHSDRVGLLRPLPLDRLPPSTGTMQRRLRHASRNVQVPCQHRKNCLEPCLPIETIDEDASRFARDLVAQELGVLLLIKRNVRVLTANGDDLTDTSDPSRVMMRQIAGSCLRSMRRRGS
jgi:hypothetical protein